MRTYHKNGRWYLEGMIRKKRFLKAIPEAVTKKDAENFMNIFKADLLRGRLELIEEIGTNKFNDIIELYIKYVQTNLRSKQAAIGYALSFSKLWGNKQIKDITPAEIEKFKQKRLETVWCIKKVGREKVPQYITASTINRQLNALSKIFSLAIDNGYLRENPVHSVKRLPVKNKIERHLSPEEETRMFKVCDNDFSFMNISEEEQSKLKQKCSDQYSYLKPILVIALNTGLRKSEILNLTWDCVDFDTNEITILDTKNGKKNRELYT